METFNEASTWISSRSRYDRFDTSPYISLYSIAKKRFSVNTFLPLRHGTAASHTQPGRFAFLGQKARFLCKKGCSEACQDIKIDVLPCDMETFNEASTWISSRSRYDRFDTSPYISLYSIAKKRFSVNTFLPLRHGTAASHTQPGRFAFLGQKARFLCKKGCSFGREPSIIGTIFFKFEV